jgi:hypothetical protein
MTVVEITVAIQEEMMEEIMISPESSCYLLSNDDVINVDNSGNFFD